MLITIREVQKQQLSLSDKKEHNNKVAMTHPFISKNKLKT